MARYDELRGELYLTEEEESAEEFKKEVKDIIRQHIDNNEIPTDQDVMDCFSSLTPSGIEYIERQVENMEGGGCNERRKSNGVT